MIDEGRVEAHPHPVVVPEIHEVEQQHDALCRGEVSEPGDSRGAPPRRIEKRDPAEERERQAEEQREPQVELEPEVEGSEQIRPGCVRKRLVKRGPESAAEHREYDEIDRGQRENETGEPREPLEHFRRGFRRLAPMSRSAT